MSNNILTAFNDHFIEFVTDVHRAFPDNEEILIAKNSIIAIRKANPKIIVKIWNTFIVGKYKNEIDNGNIEFFENKDYSTDIAGTKYTDRITKEIDRLRAPIKQMDKVEKLKAMKYIQNLTKLSTIIEQ